MPNPPNQKPIVVQTGINRRKFIYTSALFAGAATFSGCLSARPKLRSPNEKLNIAILGSGGRGASNLSDVSSENIVALCDIDETTLRKRAEKYPGARL